MLVRRKKNRGFTILEVLLVLITLGIVATAFIPTFIELVRGPETARRIEAASLAQQQCAERILAARTTLGFSLFKQNLSLIEGYCAALPQVDGLTASIKMENYTSGLCGSGQAVAIDCRKLIIGAKDAGGTTIRINDLVLIVAD